LTGEIFWYQLRVEAKDSGMPLSFQLQRLPEGFGIAGYQLMLTHSTPQFSI